MSYEIVMPQLSDSMEEGTLISWKVKEGQTVKTGDVIAEIESDKAIMDVQTFKSGTVQKLLVKENEVVPVGQVIAVIDTESSSNESISESSAAAPQEKSRAPAKEQTPIEKKIPTSKLVPNADSSQTDEPATAVKIPSIKAQEQTGISPKARAKAAQYGIDIQAILKRSSTKIVHEKEIDAYLKMHYFTPKALSLLEQYHLDYALFDLNHKIDEAEVQAYIEQHQLALPQPLTSMQKAIIASVSEAAQKPIYHLYDHLDASLLLAHKKNYSMTTWLIKIFAKTMMAHEAFRSHLEKDHLIIDPHASLAIAVADAKNLYMPVIKAADKLSVVEIGKQLARFKDKLQTKSFRAEEMQGSNFGISNLGMLGVESFDAMINKNDSGIAAIGGLIDNKISVTLTIDHRLINGYEAALFMRDLKNEVLNPQNFEE
ncbi:dihydrolipoamide acetyltransferase family protein [Galenea microaerophila]